MPIEVEISVSPDRIGDLEFIKKKALQKAKLLHAGRYRSIVLKRSIDARKQTVFRLKIALYPADENIPQVEQISDHYSQVEREPEVIIVGAGPAGYFAALECLTLGLRPIVLERGKDVRARRRDLRSIQQEGIVNPDSNYCFGEGGAGTYSDGKLYTRAKKRGRVQTVLQILVEHGADPDILIDAHPHIGSNKLPGIISAIRRTIEDHGGAVHFESKVIDLVITNGGINGVILQNGDQMDADRVILAAGHSARDIFDLLHRHHLRLEAKDFAIGLRIEHPQSLIDELQYGQNPRHDNLPAASYRLACELNEVGVFSFCMCPGGLIVPAATSPGEIVVNGMSLSKRDSPFANSGIVVSVGPEIWQELGYSGPFAGVDLQRDIEELMFEAGDGSQAAPAQRVTDFLRKNKSKSLPPTSYIPGLISVELHEILPEIIYEYLCQGILEFSKKLNGYVTSEAVLVGVESRTSSPIRIPRESKTLMHPQVYGLFPCGEGGGYAGGIVSAAIDGQVVANAVKESLKAN